MIYGDYDCDGQTSTVLLHRALDSIGPKIDYCVPLRSEGYGLKPTAIDKVSPNDTLLIITVDNGTSSHAALEKSQAIGIDVIVTSYKAINVI